MIRILLILALVVFNFLCCFLEDIYLAYRPLQAGGAAPFSLRSPVALYPGPEADGADKASGGLRPGEVIVPFRQEIRDEDLRRIRSLQDAAFELKLRQAPLILWVDVFTVVFLSFFLSTLPQAGYKRLISPHVLLIVLILYGLLMKALLLFTEWPVEALPFALLPLMLIAMNQGRVTAVGLSVAGAALTALFVGQTYAILLNLILISLAAVMVFPGLSRRRDIVLPSVLVGLVSAICVTTLNPDWTAWIALMEGVGRLRVEDLAGMAGEPSVARSAWALAGGVFSGALTLLFLPVMKAGWQVASAFSLRRYSDLDHPLLRKLRAEAPGTYQHSMNVATLAQSAGEAVGVNPLVLRVGAYFHDIGKADLPRNFVENQINCENPHNTLDPYDSIAAILDHVGQGIRMAEQARLPAVVIDLIRQHHGTQVIDFFYHKALKSRPKGSVREEEFRYPGPKPRSVEAALLMIADAVEAASRSLREPGRRELDKMVRLIVLKRIADGQLSECDLDTRDIDRIIRSLVDSLEASFHTRVPYPWQQPPEARGPGPQTPKEK
jgi:hypothetical protein